MRNLVFGATGTFGTAASAMVRILTGVVSLRDVGDTDSTVVGSWRATALAIAADSCASPLDAEISMMTVSRGVSAVTWRASCVAFVSSPSCAMTGSSTAGVVASWE